MSELNAYDYELPRELIAQQPIGRRSDARMMVVRRREGEVEHAHVRDLLDYLNAGDTLVLNDTRVLRARLLGYRIKTGGRWEGLFLAADSEGNWQILGKTRGKLQPNDVIMLQDRAANDACRLIMVADQGDGVWIARLERDEPPVPLLERIGRVPLPPYIRGGRMQDVDMERYQTVFARQPGAIAAPTAGLHFTETLLGKLSDAGIQITWITLHVGVGTFRPIQVSRLADHTMHSEWGRIDASTVGTLRETRARGGRIVAVGTTSVRVLETAARDGTLCPWEGTTDLFIRPPHQFHAVDAMLTNFHLPKSTLLVLVRAFGGDSLLRRAYASAVEEQYRFFSYGDAMLIL